MKNQTVYTIKDFADQVGRSRQYIYSILDTKLKDYVKVIDDKKYIDKSAVLLFDDKKVDSKKDCKVDDNLTLLLDILQKQLQAKDRQIERLQEALDNVQKIQLSHAKIELLEAETLQELQSPKKTRSAEVDDHAVQIDGQLEAYNKKKKTIWERILKR